MQPIESHFFHSSHSNSQTNDIIKSVKYICTHWFKEIALQYKLLLACLPSSVCNTTNGLPWTPRNLSFRYIHCTGQFTPKMKANMISYLLSSLVWINQYNEYNGMTSLMEFMACFQCYEYEEFVRFFCTFRDVGSFSSWIL